MQRRGLVAVLFTVWLLTGAAGVANAAPRAATPGPSISPPPQCYVIKNGALPTCEKNADGTWTVVYPTGHGNLDSGTSSGHDATWDIELAVALAAIIGIAVIVWRTWLTPGAKRDVAIPVIAGPIATGEPIPPATQTTPGAAPPPPPPTDGYFASKPTEPPAPPATGADYSPR
jgi:hypothetical protein